jgi:N-acyl-D-aspartate/D-glutamate deacylase
MYRVSGRPIEVNILTPTPDSPMGWQRVLEFANECAAEGIRVHPQFTTNKLELHLKLGDTFIFDEMPIWREVLTQPEPERSKRLGDPAWRGKLRAAFDDPTGRNATFRLGELEVEAVREDRHAALVGRTLDALGAERGVDPFDLFLDLSLAEGLEMSFRTRISEVGEKFIRHVVETGVKDPLVMAGSSDGGAHLASFVGADYTTRLLSDWVPDTLSLEQAVWRLAGMPATVHGLVDRGFLRVGAWADVTVFDPSRLRAGDAYLARDFPAETERYVIDAEGYALVVVNGEALVEAGVPTGALPGHVLRGG